MGNEFDPQTYAGQAEGGLLGLLYSVIGKSPGSGPKTQADYTGAPSKPRPQSMQQAITDFSGARASLPDPVDITKSLGIGVFNGLLNTVGFPAEVLTGFGYFPDHLVENSIRRRLGYPDLSSGESGYVDGLKPDALRHFAEGHIGPLYQAKSEAGLYAETIGEMLPMALGGGSSLRELPGTLLKHAVAPGIAIQALEEAYPKSRLGQSLQKAYPALRRTIPVAFAAKRYLSRRLAP